MAEHLPHLNLRIDVPVPQSSLIKEKPPVDQEPINGAKRLYMRFLSNLIRKWTTTNEINTMQESPVFSFEGRIKAIIVCICRIRQRLLTESWQVFTTNTGVKHDYEPDVRLILYRHIPEDEHRTELEIEVLYKWMQQVCDLDPTGIAKVVVQSKSKAAIYAALQQVRLEFYAPGETIIFQGDIPRPEDGHFTVFKGNCDVLQFPEESVPLIKLLYLAKKRRWDDAIKLLHSAPIVSRIPKLSGFGELSTVTGVKRAASIRASINTSDNTELLVLPKDALVDCLKTKVLDGLTGTATGEAIDFLRQSGLANHISPTDLATAAESMIRRTLLQGDILYFKGQTVRSMCLVVSGELLLDTGDLMIEDVPSPFVNAEADKCYLLSSGSILGDEGVTGEQRLFASTAAVVSSAAVVFEAVGFGLQFLIEKLGCLRYSALYYRDKLRWDFSHPLAEQINPYTYFNSLRKSVAFHNPFRGTKSSSESMGIKPIGNNTPFVVNTGNVNADGRAMKPQRERRKDHRGSMLRGADSRASFLLMTKTDSVEGNTIANSDDLTADFPKTLTGLGRHRAFEVAKIVKRNSQHSAKFHAKVS